MKDRDQQRGNAPPGIQHAKMHFSNSLLFVVARRSAERASHPFGEPWITPQPLRGAVAQHVRNPPPAERDADIRERQRHGAEPALKGTVADAQVELTDA